MCWACNVMLRKSRLRGGPAVQATSSNPMANALKAQAQADGHSQVIPRRCASPSRRRDGFAHARLVAPPPQPATGASDANPRSGHRHSVVVILANTPMLRPWRITSAWLLDELAIPWLKNWSAALAWIGVSFQSANVKPQIIDRRSPTCRPWPPR